MSCYDGVLKGKVVFRLSKVKLCRVMVKSGQVRLRLEKYSLV